MHRVIHLYVVTNLPSSPDNNGPTSHAEHLRAIAITELAVVTRYRYKYSDNTIGLY